MSFFEWMGAALGAVLILYIAARIISAAVFRSKQDYDNQRNSK